MSAYRSLGGVLNRLLEDPAVKETPELAKKVSDAVGFHVILGDEYDLVVRELETCQRQLDELTRDPNALTDTVEFSAQLRKYTRLSAEDYAPAEVYHTAISDGLSPVEALRVLRSVFNLPMEELLAVRRAFEVAPPPA